MSVAKKLKFLCLLAFLSLAVIAFFSSNRVAHITEATSGGPPAGFSGAPDENNCAACHTDLPDTGTFTITAPANYVPGQTYSISVQHNSTDMTRRRWGFQMTSLAGSSGAGTFSTVNNLTQTLSDSGRSYIQHTSTGTFAGQTGGSTWTFNWNAPATNVGAVTLYAAGNQADNDTSSDGDCILTANRVIQPQAAVNFPPIFDFDGDDKTDIGIFRPEPAEWWYLRSSDGGNRAFQFGQTSDKIVPADYTGDGKTDIAFWRPSNGQWFILRSEDSSFFAFPFGANGDVPAPADYDGDNKADAAVFRPSSTTWFIQKSTGGTTITQFGVAGDVPAVADYDGDSKADIAIFRPGAGEWWIQRSTAGLLAFQFGSSTDKIVQGDYTGDGKADSTFWRPSTGQWFVLRSEDLSFFAAPFGANGDVPAPGDYDGDGKNDLAVFRPSSNTWFINRSTAGTLITGFGISGDVPLQTAFVP
ncbi:MAG TPA: FG-GAP-like repeat-containing protein [Pyrinomonadaceae bacterium]|nr:FG-GAP-like repeat-containing protein [Pyrinomonadaceae bacterium]